MRAERKRRDKFSPDYAANQRLVKASFTYIRFEYQQTEDRNPNKLLTVRLRIICNVPCTFSLHFNISQRSRILTQLITFTRCVSIILPRARDISVSVSLVFSSLSLKFLEHLNDCTPRVRYNVVPVKASRVRRNGRMQRNVAKYWKLDRCYAGITPQGFRCNREISAAGTCVRWNFIAQCYCKAISRHACGIVH